MKIGFKAQLAVFFAVIFFLSTGLLFYSKEETRDARAAMTAGEITVLLDAGHGGFDGGASVDGIMEKHINLSLAKKLSDVLTQKGIRVIMTREEDKALSDGSDTSSKRQDMRRRRALMEEHPTAIFMSIHMNKFEQSSCKGAQVFYGKKNEKSELLAECIQAAIKRDVLPDNHRKAKKAGDNIYLLSGAHQPAVIVECGFLSNPEEFKLLQTEEYQQKMANAIATGLSDFLVGEKDPNQQNGSEKNGQE